MNEFESAQQRRDRIQVRIVSWVFGGAILAFVLWFLVFGVVQLAPYSLSETMIDNQRVHPQQVVDTLCATEGCTDAWKTDVGTFMEFKSEREAEFVAYVVGDQCRRNGKVIVDFGNLKLTTQQKVDAINLLYPGKDWY